MGSKTSKVKEVDEIKAVEEMIEDELSQKDKMFRSAIIELANEIKEVKNQKKDKLYIQFQKWIYVIGVYFNLIILIKYNIIKPIDFYLYVSPSPFVS